MGHGCLQPLKHYTCLNNTSEHSISRSEYTKERKCMHRQWSKFGQTAASIGQTMAVAGQTQVKRQSNLSQTLLLPH